MTDSPSPTPIPTPPPHPQPRPGPITRGARVIGSNLADSLLGDGHDVLLFDNLGRAGVARNLDWLRQRHGRRVAARIADIRDTQAVAEAVGEAGAVVHLAAQVAVTESLDNPLEDFTVNAAGTVHLLEALRRRGAPVPCLFASTNKVYGALGDLEMEALQDRVQPADAEIRAAGIPEARPLDFCTPYGCSKGAADQYVLDYAASFGLPAIVLRMSCIYGPRQFGTEDQGWVAHFLIRALRDEPLTLFGDGRQVRDLLFVGDAVRAYRLLLDSARRHAGRAFNLGGGPGNAVSLLALIAHLEGMLGRPVRRSHAPVRPGDQPWFVADTRRLAEATGWQAATGWRDGLRALLDWLQADPPAAGAETQAPTLARSRSA